MVSAQDINDWRDSAACLNIDPEIPFRDPESEEVRWFAQVVCGACPVKQRCLEFALRAGCHYGVFGGVLPNRRKRMPKRRDVKPCGTPAGYQRHKRAGEQACPACAFAAQLDDEGRRDLRARQVVLVPAA